jgi:hypothetical protein
MIPGRTAHDRPDEPEERPMNDAEEQFARRLAEDLEHVLGSGLAVADIELDTADGRAHASATLLIEGRVETVEVDAADIVSLYRPLMERAAELRLAGAFWRMIGPV